MRNYYLIPPAKHKVVQHLVRYCDTLTSGTIMGLCPFPGKGAEKPGKCRVFPSISTFLPLLNNQVIMQIMKIMVQTINMFVVNTYGK